MCSFPSIVGIETNDIVFPEVIALCTSIITHSILLSLLARHRPQAGAGAAGQNDWYQQVIRTQVTSTTGISNRKKLQAKV
jgi:hypothetical protein